MTPCEKLGYKVGDRFEIVNGSENDFPWNENGLIITLTNDNGTDQPRFKFPCGNIWVKTLTNVRPLKPQTEAEKRGVKFGTMGVVKATGERVVFQKEARGIWYFLTEGSRMTLSYNTHEIRLDHEPEYKEIPFMDATDEQRMDVGNLILSGGSKINGIEKSICGRYYMLTHGGVMCTTYDEDGNGIHFSDFTDPSSYILTVRVPA